MQTQQSLWRRALAVALPEHPTRGYWIALIGTAVLLRFIVSFVVLGGMPVFSDAKNYSGQAVDLIHGRTHLPYYWPPGTSYVLAAGYWLFGIHRWVAHLVMLLLNVGAVITTALIARKVLRNDRAAMLAGWLVALYPGFIMQTSQPDSFDLTLLGVNLTALFALRAWERGRMLDYAAAGVGLGLAALTRPSTLSLLLALGLVAAIAIRRRQEQGIPTGFGRAAVGAAVLVACTGATVAPAVAHNIVNHQGATISVNNELNTWLGNNPYTPNYKTDDIGQHPVSSFPPDEQRYLRHFVYGEIPTRAQRSADLDEAKRFVEHHPAISLWRTLNRVRGFWGFEYTISNNFRVEWSKGAKAEGVGLIFEAGGYFVLALLAFIGLIFARGLMRPGMMWFLVALIAAFELPYALVYGAGRWHYPALGLVAVIAGAGAWWLIDTPDRWRRIRASTAFWVVIAVFALIQIEYAYFLVRPG